MSGCAGFQLGNRSLYPAHIETVHVPIFKSASFRRNQGERLTEAVIKEIERITPYKVVHDPNRADSILSGTITEDTKRVVVGTLSGEPREIESGLRVEILWEDRRGEALRDFQPIAIEPELTYVGGNDTFVPEIGQSGVVAQQEAIGRIAAQIVGLMENPW